MRVDVLEVGGTEILPSHPVEHCVSSPRNEEDHQSREINEAFVLEEGEIGIEMSSWLFHQRFIILEGQGVVLW